MNIEWVIPCRYVEVHDSLGTIIGAGIDTLWLPDLPAPIQVLLALRLLATEEELTADQKHPVTNRVRDPHGEIVSDVSGELSIAGESTRPEWVVGIIVPALVQFEATDEGTYTIEQTVDEASVSLPIHIVHGLPPGAT
jgi:hypothetical protein